MDSSYVPIESSSHHYSGSYINQPAAPKQQSKVKLIVIAVVAVVVLCGIGAIAVLLANSGTDGSDDDYITNLKDPNDNTEQLNPHLSELIKTAPHADYSTSSINTAFVNAPTTLFSTKGSASDAVYAAAFSVLKNSLILIDSLKGQTPQSIAASQNIKLESVPAVNANAINYYLDNRSVLIIEATGSAPFDSETVTPILIYGGHPDLGVYYYFTLDSKCPECDFPYLISKVQLFDAIKDNEKFTVISNNAAARGSGDEVEYE